MAASVISALVIIWAFIQYGPETFFALRLTFGSAILLVGVMLWLWSRIYGVTPTRR